MIDLEKVAEALYRRGTATGHAAFRKPWDKKAPLARQWWVDLLRGAVRDAATEKYEPFARRDEGGFPW